MQRLSFPKQRSLQPIAFVRQTDHEIGQFPPALGFGSHPGKRIPRLTNRQRRSRQRTRTARRTRLANHIFDGACQDVAGRNLDPIQRDNRRL